MTLVHHVTFEDSSVLVWISPVFPQKSPKMPAPGSSSNITVRSGRAPMASRTFLKACSRWGLGWERLLESHGFHHKRWRMVVEGTESWHVTVNSIDRILLSEIGVPNRRGTMD